MRFVAAMATGLLQLFVSTQVPAHMNGRLWQHANLFAWGITVDSKSRTVEEQAEMLSRLGINQVAYSWQGKNEATLERDLGIFKRHGIHILATPVTDVSKPEANVDWTTRQNQELGVTEGWLKPAADALTVGEMLEVFKRHRIQPQLWLIRNMQEVARMEYPQKAFDDWSDDEKNRAFRNGVGYDPTPSSQTEARVQKESARIRALAELAAQYGIMVGLYKHAGWIGMADNQVAIVQQLKQQSIHNVGIVYQFIHAHDEVDETPEFHTVWKKIEPYVMAVNITGVRKGSTAIYPVLYPSQGSAELDMMKVIEDSRWQGPIGVSAEKGGDAELNLRNNLLGLDWLAANLARPGSGGSAPFGHAQ